ncbi:MAG: SUMF1/EgtB/PvdO family nonheme iron enzyme [Candidatus Omnitrophica bacterium]|nr:SUMF1/EgtB/PvdO family nonheme iron enzyme [Candidatus Omnitrophota bacterium]
MSSKYKIILLVFSFLIVCPASLALANNLVISNVTLEDRNASANTMVVQFDISWDHSWRKNDGRHDAAWIFTKIYCAPGGVASYVHGKMYTAGTNPADTSPGSNADVKIVVPSDKIGAFISRQATGNGAFSSKKVRLNVDYGTNGCGDSDSVQVKVFGIEMVYIPEGPFYIGDGNGSQESLYAFHLNGADNTAVQITTAVKSITVDLNGSDDIDTSPITVTGLSGITGNTSWPNGYAAYYLMKYELSQGQYVDFLNTLTRVQQGNRVAATVSGNTITNYYVMSNGTSVGARNGIRAPASGNGTSPTTVVFGNDLSDNGTFNETDDGQNISMGYINYMDFDAYADWAGLRPVTELEYEKAARGPNSAVYDEYAWGTTKSTAMTSIVNSGRNSEIAGQSGEGPLNGSNGISGPLRAGFSATNATNRKSAGAGYYGNMDLTGNIAEFYISIGESTGRVFTGTHGDGTLTTTASYEGNATNNDWPGIDATTARGVTGPSGSGTRGADFANFTAFELSDRSRSKNILSTRLAYTGGRAARTAP